MKEGEKKSPNKTTFSYSSKRQDKKWAEKRINEERHQLKEAATQLMYFHKKESVQEPSRSLNLAKMKSFFFIHISGNTEFKKL